MRKTCRIVFLIMLLPVILCGCGVYHNEKIEYSLVGYVVSASEESIEVGMLKTTYVYNDDEYEETGEKITLSREVSGDEPEENDLLKLECVNGEVSEVDIIEKNYFSQMYELGLMTEIYATLSEKYVSLNNYSEAIISKTENTTRFNSNTINIHIYSRYEMNINMDNVGSEYKIYALKLDAKGESNAICVTNEVDDTFLFLLDELTAQIQCYRLPGQPKFTRSDSEGVVIKLSEISDDVKPDDRIKINYIHEKHSGMVAISTDYSWDTRDLNSATMIIDENGKCKIMDKN